MLGVCLAGLAFAYSNLQGNLAARGLSQGFAFLRNEAGFDIAETPPVPLSPAVLGALAGFVVAIFAAKFVKVFEIRRPALRAKAHLFLGLRVLLFFLLTAFGALLAAILFSPAVPAEGEFLARHFLTYETTGSYTLALATGLANTLKVAATGLLLAGLVGLCVGLARVSNNPLLQNLGASFVTLVRGIPLLLQLAFWYVLLVHTLPLVEQGFSLGNFVYLNNRGLFLPAPVWSGGALSFDFPELVFGNRNIRGGLTLSPEFVALVAGLSIYHGAFIAEIVRAGINSVARGQREAAAALGLSSRLSLQKIVLPQALRVMIPNFVSQGLNLTKNSSLAVAIGYRDLVSVGNTVINQSGQAMEVIAIWMLVYLGLSLAFSLWLNLHLKQIQPRSAA